MNINDTNPEKYYAVVDLTLFMHKVRQLNQRGLLALACFDDDSVAVTLNDSVAGFIAWLFVVVIKVIRLYEGG
jgi:hypothetical protein